MEQNREANIEMLSQVFLTGTNTIPRRGGSLSANEQLGFHRQRGEEEVNPET